MRVELIPHRDFRSAVIDAVEVELNLMVPGVVTVWYSVFGSLTTLIVPPQTPQRRSDRLWKTTCFEMFVREPPDAGYMELNFSPSSEWAAYSFDRYRVGMRPADLPRAPIISSSEDNRFELCVSLPLDLGTGLRVQLSAVLEEKDGTKSYWALAHPQGAPDFHDPDCFVLELPPAPGSSSRT